ncbi:hypothetical protein PZA11_007413 [Diplocarpon coronariae]|uniref:Uncharacterized protein n=1 Tax=Diplocarpon coronariae TaxID=2795749 RepID=A0A218Z4Y7_9HELO|nr:hypothetical protein JHW43_004458 [Diplocarpon mali]OWP03107.1 hypothetical protein B2J93_6424 [Marssonina coronariae]
MRLRSTLYSLALLLSATRAVDMRAYQASAGVEPEFQNFIEKFYFVSEDPELDVAYTLFWSSAASMILAGHEFTGWTDILNEKKKLLPPTGGKSWWHLIRGVTVQEETPTTKTYDADIVIQTTYTPGNCSEAYGKAAFTILKNDEGTPRLVPFTKSLSLYNLTLSTTDSPTDNPCSPTTSPTTKPEGWGEDFAWW